MQVVTAGSYDILHRGHTYILGQVWTLARAMRNEALNVIIWSDHPHKRFLLSGPERHQAVKTWAEANGIAVNIHLLPALFETDPAYLAAFREAIGLNRNDPELLFVAGVKGEDIAFFEERQRTYNRNQSVSGNKIAFVVGTPDRKETSSYLRNELLSVCDDSAAYAHRIARWISEEIITPVTGQLLLTKRANLCALKGSAVLTGSVQGAP